MSAQFYETKEEANERLKWNELYHDKVAELEVAATKGMHNHAETHGCHEVTQSAVCSACQDANTGALGRRLWACEQCGLLLCHKCWKLTLLPRSAAAEPPLFESKEQEQSARENVEDEEDRQWDKTYRSTASKLEMAHTQGMQDHSTLVHPCRELPRRNGNGNACGACKRNDTTLWACEQCGLQLCDMCWRLTLLPMIVSGGT